MLSIAEYVKQRGISQTAVRRQLARYEKELEGHTPKVNRRTMLDDYAIEFLDSHRMPREVIIQQASDEVQKEINNLKATLDLMKDKVQELHEQIIFLQDEKMQHIADQTRNQLLLEAKDKETADLQEKLETRDQENRDLQDQLKETRKEVEEAKQEANRYTKSWFGFYRRKDD